jgi:hypothetical protein
MIECWTSLRNQMIDDGDDYDGDGCTLPSTAELDD